MEHFYQYIDGWFDFATIYEQAVARASNGAHFVEVGAWKGKSAAYMAVEIANSKKSIRFDVVDTWKGSPEHKNVFAVKHDTLFREFIGNMKSVREYYQPIKATSITAASLYPDNSLDFVFLDADHSYESVKQDILAWLPKVKLGGVLAGDDYYHWPGVAQAVNEILKKDFTLSCGDNDLYCWSYKKVLDALG